MSSEAAMESQAPLENADNHIAPVPRISAQAFCESDNLIAMIEAASRDRRMAKAHVKVQKGGLPAALEAYKNAPTPNLIILETVASRTALLAQLESLAEYCDAGTKVLVIGHENDIALYRDLTSQGVSDYIVAPVSLLEFIGRVSLLYNGPKSEPLGLSAAVIGARGGIGSSTLAQNLAWSVSREFGMETVIADLDLPFGTVALNYNQDPAQGIADAIYSPDRLDAQYLDGLLSRGAEHLSILASPANLERVYDFDAYTFDPVVELLSAIAPWSIIDVPHCWNGWTKRILSAADDVIIVAGPDLPSLRNTKNIVDALHMARPNDKPPQVVLNMVGVPKRPEISIGEFARAAGIEPVVAIPFEPKLFGIAANNGQMLAEVDPSSRIVEMIEDLGIALARRERRRREGKGVWAKLVGRILGGKTG